MPFAELPTGATLDYVDTGGDGVPVMLIHGMLGTPETQVGNVLDWLRKDYRVIAPTLRGYGQSLPKPRQFPHNFYLQDAADVIALMDHLQIEKAHILGFSDGGEIAFIVGGTAPEKALSVTGWGAIGYYGPSMLAVAQNMFPATWLTQEEKDLHDIKNADAMVLQWIQTIKRIIESGGDLSVSLAKKIQAPLLLMLGDQDRLNPVEYAQKFLDQTPNGRLETFSSGHAIHEEAWPEFKATVGTFLANA